MPPAQTLYLIDGSAYVYRAYHAIRAGLSNSRGMPTNASYGFTQMLVKLIKEQSPRYVAVAFDVKGPTFRHEIYPAYKANRPPMPEDLAIQIPVIREIVQGFRIPLLERTGFEADDLIGTLARKAEAAGFDVVVVSGDKDFIQIVTEKTRIWDPMKEKETRLADVRKDFGVAPAQMIDVMGLSGDTSDNVPGVPGIGPKTALALIQTFGGMDRLYEQVHAVTRKKQHENLVQFKDQAFLSRNLVTIKTDAPLDFDAAALALGPPDKAALTRIFQEMEFRGFQDLFAEAAPETAAARCITILDPEVLAQLMDRLSRTERLAVDTETTSQDPMRARLVGISVSFAPNEAYYIPCGHDYIGAPEQISREAVVAAFRPVLENPAIAKIGQNIKYDWIVLARHGIRMAGVAFDTMVASYLLDPGKRAHSLDSIALDFLNHRTISFADVAGKGKAQVGFNAVILEKAAPYACEDADVTLRAAAVLEKRIRDLSLMDLMEQVEMPLLPVLVSMEMRGMTVDRERLSILSRDLESQLHRLEAEIHDLAGERFNIQSSQQLGTILFDKLKLPVQKKTQKKTGYSTDIEVLTTLALLHELPARVLRHRTLAKLKSTYTDALQTMIHPETGRIHTSFNQTVAATGRLSSSEPNLQNIPIRTPEGVEIRRAFIPRKGWRLLAADYSQIELRLLAHYADDAILIQAFREGEDIHARTAAEVFGMPAQAVSPELRRQAKTINFGILYGMGAFSLSKELGISRPMAQTYIDHYFARYHGVKGFIDRTIAEARRRKQVSTLLGRIRLLPEIDSGNANIRGFAERTAVNTPIQGTAADLIKIAMIRVHRALESRGLKAAMLLSVHDELVFEVPPDEVETVGERVRAEMEGVYPDLRVPLTVNLGWGENWAEAH